MSSSTFLATILALFGIGAIALLFWIQDRRENDATLPNHEGDPMPPRRLPVRRYLEVTAARRPRGSATPLIVLLLIGILLAVTNPSQSDFDDYLLRVAESQSSSNDPLTMAVTRLMFGAFKPLIARRDFAVFSIFKLRVDKDREYFYLGIAKQFMPWPVNWPMPKM